MQHRSLVVGIDLGGSGTRAALADDEGEVIASGHGPAAGYARGATGRRQLARALSEAMAPIQALAGSDARVVHAGTRGSSIPGRREGLEYELRHRFPGAEVRITDDALIALWGGLAGGEGIAVLSGTGSIALARAADERLARAGGWGPLLGDEGSGYWLGREAIVALLRVLEQGAQPGGLTASVRATLGRSAATMGDVISWPAAEPRPVRRLAQLAPLVSSAAEAGDPVAIDILARAASALADLAAAAAHQLWPAVAPDPLRVVCCGQVWRAGPRLHAPFASAIRAALPTATVQSPVLPGVGGAVLLALGADRQAVAPGVVERLIATLRP